MMHRLVIAVMAAAGLASCSGAAPVSGTAVTPAGSGAGVLYGPPPTAAAAVQPSAQIVLPTKSEFLVDIPHNWQQLPVNEKILLHTVDPTTNIHCFENAAAGPPALAQAGADQVRQMLTSGAGQAFWSGVFKPWRDVVFKSVAMEEPAGWPQSRATADMKSLQGASVEATGVLTLLHGYFYSLMCFVPQQQLGRPHPEVNAFLASFRRGSSL